MALGLCFLLAIASVLRAQPSGGGGSGVVVGGGGGGSSGTAPSINSPSSSSITVTSASLSGNVTSDGGATITARGVVYSATATNSNPRLGGTGVTNATTTGTTGAFTVDLSGLSATTAYSYAAYATNSAGTTYTSNGTFTTLGYTTLFGMTTLAGSAGNSGSADGTGSAARFSNPAGMAVDSAGNVYVADSGNFTIRKITPGGVVTTLAGLAGSRGSADGTGNAARFDGPDSVAVDSAGNVYVTDASHAVREITPAGVVTTLAGSVGNSGSIDGTASAARFNGPGGVAVDSAGNVYVADTGNSTIRKIAPTGVVTTLAGSAGASGSSDGTGSTARFNRPRSVAVDSAGNVFVTDVNFTVRKITPGGVVTTLAGSAGNSGFTDATGSAARFSNPFGVAADGTGNVYVTEFTANTVRKITAGGVVTTLAGTAGGSGSTDGTGGSARFSSPFGVAVDSAGNLFVADSANNTIRKLTSGGMVTTLAGSAGLSGLADGTGSAARFNNPSGVAVDSAGNVYVADTDNNTIRKITPAGVVTTLAGTAGIPAVSTDGTGSAARFSLPNGVAVDGVGNVYVTQNSSSVRKITSGGVVTTLAGSDGNSGSIDGTGSAARVYSPGGVAVDSAGNVYVADTGNDTIRKITPGGFVTTMAGVTGGAGVNDGGGSAVRFDLPRGIAVDSAGNVYVTDGNNNTIRIGVAVASTAPPISSPSSTSITTTTAVLGGNVTADGGSAITARGVVYSVTATNNNPQLGGTGVTNAGSAGTTGAFTINATGLISGTSYSYAAYATNSTGTSYTSVGTFTTLSAATAPSITAPTSASVAGTTATLGGNVTADGGATITAIGVVYSATATNSNPRLNGTGVTNATGTGATGVFTVNVTGLSAGTAYTYAAYATNSVGTTYTSTGTFTTTSPVISPPSSIAATVTIGNTTQAYDGSAKGVSVTTSPAGLSTSITYLGGSGTPLGVGTYQVVVNVTSPGYGGSAIGSLTITKGTATVTLGADNKSATTMPAGLGVTLTFNGGTAVPTTPGTYAVAATVNDPNYTGSATGTLVVSKLTQMIVFNAPTAQKTTAGALTLSATASSGLPVTFAVVSGPAMLSGNTLSLTGAAGTVVVTASQAGNATYSAAPDVTGSFVVTAVGPQIFFGSTGSNDTLAANVSADNKSGTIIGYLAGSKLGFVVNFSVNTDGTFSAPATIFSGSLATGSAIASPRDTTADVHAAAAAAASLTFQGKVLNGVLSGSIVELTLPFSATVQPPVGPSAGVAGYYQAAATNTATGNTYSIVGTQGQVYVLAVTPTIVASGTASLAANNTFTAQSTQNATITGAIDQPTTTVSGTITVPGQPTSNFAGLVTTTTRTDRLINLSSRSQVTRGSNVLIAGFVIGGPASKTVLLRGVGPGLGSFGLSGVLAKPSLQLYDTTGKLLLTNTGWAGDATLAATFARVGAFALATTSADAAVTTTLAPGAYTMVLSNAGSDTGGVALAEIYDASSNPSADYQRLVNISTRGTVGPGVLVGGFVVAGNSTKKLLIRGIGPGLGAFGVAGTLADPQLQVFDNKSAVLAQNDNWGTPQAINGAQTPATAADLITAANTTGAFALPAGSKDSALIVTLAPGQYTAQVSGPTGATGIALVEIYELPNN